MAEPIKVSMTEDGIRLARWFGRHYPSVNIGELRKLCRSGQIRINSRRCRGDEILKSGDMVRVPPGATSRIASEKPKRTESGERFSMRDLENLRTRIIHDDADIVVFDKPAGLATQGGTGIQKSLDKMAAAMFPHDKIMLVHRLDRDTSGVIVLAKNQRAAQLLAEEFSGRDAKKEYLALLSGNVSPKSGIIDNFMVKGRVISDDEADELKKESGVRAHRAITKYEVVSHLPGLVSWVRFSPVTGRTHQLRLHSAFSLNAPIVGDDIYGRCRSSDCESAAATLRSFIDNNNLFLFAHRLSFKHPSTGKVVTVRAPLPDFMRGVAKLLELRTE
ncbi:MAG: RluA family pseudouridine synthase [Alphaproteobacteria bacterium]|nr:RluA family pseudouridine synthase [Alphaproteobacteria bacterium]